MVTPIIITLIVIIMLLYFINNKEFYSDGDDEKVIAVLKNQLHIIDPEFCNLKIYPSDQSVTVNKKKIYLCLRDPKTRNFYPLEVLIYVTLHEIAHIKSKSYSSKSHNEEFYKNFEELLNKTISKGVLLKNIHIPENYCQR